MTPADQTSMAVVCVWHLKRTSGARKPRVPARDAFIAGLEGKTRMCGLPWIGGDCARR